MSLLSDPAGRVVRGPLRAVAHLLTAAVVASASIAHAHLPLDLALHRHEASRLYIDLDRDSVPDLTLPIGVAFDRVSFADMDGDGLADVVLYRDGTFHVDRTLTGVFTERYPLGGVPGDVGLAGDVDGDGAVDLVVFRDGTWFASTRRDGVADRAFHFGAAGDKPLLCDVDFNGVADLVVFRDGVFFVDSDRDGSSDAALSLGQGGDEPVCADFDGDGRDDLGVYRDGVWRVLLDSIADPHAAAPIGFGAPGDRPLAGRFDRRLSDAKFRTARFRFGVYDPVDNQLHFRIGDEIAPGLNLAPDAPAGVAVAGDFDGDGRSDVAIVTDGVWRIDFDLDGRADVALGFGAPADVPLAGDVDGDGDADFALYRSGRWFFDTDGDGIADVYAAFGGEPQDVPLLADVDGDGRADLAVYRDGRWFVDTDRDGTADVALGFGGAPGDIPVLVDWSGSGHAEPAIYRAGTWYLTHATSGGQVEAIVSLGDASTLPLVGRFVLDGPGAPVLFAPKARPIPGDGAGFISASAYDADADGWVDVLGGRNAAGTIQPRDWASLGLGSLFEGGRRSRDARFADLDGDGVADIVSNTYAPLGDAASFARLYRGNGDGTYTEDPAFAALAIRGYGETIVVADFDDDGTIDIFLPFYSHSDPAEHSYLLTKRPGGNRYIDVADAAGVALRDVPADRDPEAAQAADFDDDGMIDLYVGGHLFRNNGDMTFTDVTANVGLDAGFDEGAKFVDWNNDGRLDLVVHHPNNGPVLWEFDGTRFARREAFPRYVYGGANGLQAVDLDGDGREDVVVGSGSPQGRAVVFRNVGGRFVREPHSLLEGLRFGMVTTGDFDRDGRSDLLVQRAVGPAVIAKSLGPAPPARTVTIEVVDQRGRRNQQGRVVRVMPDDASGRTFTRVVDGGSGYLSQTAYAVEVTTDYAGAHQASVRFGARVVTFGATPGQRLRVYANGRVEPM